MEKKNWVKPVIDAVEFAANEYVSACRNEGSNHQLFKFVCNLPFKAYIFYDMDNNKEFGLNGTNWFWGKKVNGIWQVVDGPTGSDSDDRTYFMPCEDAINTTKFDTFHAGFAVDREQVDWEAKTYIDASGTSVTVGDSQAYFLDADYKATDVLIWNGNSGTETHATDNIEIETWEAAFS